MTMGAILALGMGLVLGLLGGGGSILSVPILVYALGLETKSAIATSLLVVGATSLVALVPHAHRGNVLWAKGLLFGGFAMAGAFGGGQLAARVPGFVLLALFAGMMVATALAMLRPGDEQAEHVDPSESAGWKVALEGLLVGVFTGLVGAGGGFLVVPALVLFGGVPMRAAVGTSLLIISLKSFAGLAGYLSHAAIDPSIAVVVTTAAMLGAVVGGIVSTHTRPELLKRAFAWLVLVMGAGMLHQEVDFNQWRDGMVLALPLLGGVLIGASAALLLWWTGRIAGISGIVAGLLRPTEGEVAWRVTFVGGLLAGGGLLAVFDAPALELTAPSSLGLVACAGALVGVGTRLGSGCTSGHGVCGIGRFSVRSMVATMTFIGAGMVTVYFVHPGGLR